jgi:hypothetical protein
MWKVTRVAEWTGWCSPCGSSDRPLVLTRSGPTGLWAWLSGHGDEDCTLQLTCRACGEWQVVPAEADDAELATSADSTSLTPAVVSAVLLAPAVPALLLQPTATTMATGELRLVGAVAARAADRSLAVAARASATHDPTDHDLQVTAATPTVAVAEARPVVTSTPRVGAEPYESTAVASPLVASPDGESVLDAMLHVSSLEAVSLDVESTDAPVSSDDDTTSAAMTVASSLEPALPQAASVDGSMSSDDAVLLDAVLHDGSVSSDDAVLNDAVLLDAVLLDAVLLDGPVSSHDPVLLDASVPSHDAVLLDAMSVVCSQDGQSVDESLLRASADSSVPSDDDASTIDVMLDPSRLDEPALQAEPVLPPPTAARAVDDDAVDADAAAASEEPCDASSLDLTMPEDLALLDTAELLMDELADEVALQALTGSLHTALTPVGAVSNGLRSSGWASGRPPCRLHRSRTSLHRQAGRPTAQPTQPTDASSPSHGATASPPSSMTPPEKAGVQAGDRSDAGPASHSGDIATSDRGGTRLVHRLPPSDSSRSGANGAEPRPARGAAAVRSRTATGSSLRRSTDTHRPPPGDRT